MSIYLDDNTLPDDVPAADAAEQLQPVDASAEDAVLGLEHAANLMQQGANPSDVIDQAVIVPMPDDRDFDSLT